MLIGLSCVGPLCVNVMMVTPAFASSDFRNRASKLNSDPKLPSCGTTPTVRPEFTNPRRTRDGIRDSGIEAAEFLASDQRPGPARERSAPCRNTPPLRD